MSTARFDPKLDSTLNVSEKYIRDRLGIELGGWARFRREINCGTDTKHLTFESGQETTEKKDAYLDLGKSIYEVICCIGYANWNLLDLKTSRITKLESGEANPADYLVFLKLVKEFYYHAGSVMDNLARLILIVNHAMADTQMTGSGSNKVPIRRHVSWGDLRKNKYGRFAAYEAWTQNNADLDGLLLVRHFLTHCWSPPKKIDAAGLVSWPVDIRTRKVFVWPHDAHEKAVARSLTYTAVIPMIESDFKVIEKTQNEIFHQLTEDVAGYESRNGFTTSKITGQFLSPD